MNIPNLTEGRASHIIIRDTLYQFSELVDYLPIVLLLMSCHSDKYMDDMASPDLKIYRNYAYNADIGKLVYEGIFD